MDGGELAKRVLYIWTAAICLTATVEASAALSTANISHRTIPTNGIKLHVAEIGDGPAVLFLHGFPELWYTWRHQMVSLASRGYRAIAPDLRGYGDSDAPPSASNYTVVQVVGDLVGLLDALGLGRVYLVGHDWGAYMAWYFSLFRPKKVKALINMSVVYTPRNPTVKPVESLRQQLGDDYYIIKFQKPGYAERVFGRIGTTCVITNTLTSRDPSPPRFPKFFESNGSTPLPPWLSEDDVKYYVAKYNKTGFTGGLNYYRALDMNWNVTVRWTGIPIRVATKFIVGDLDPSYNAPGVKEFISNGGFKKYVELLKEVVVLKGVGHFINEEKPRQISDHIYNFIRSIDS